MNEVIFMNENELKSIERYFNKFNEDAASFNEFEANDFIKLLKNNREYSRRLLTTYFRLTWTEQRHSASFGSITTRTTRTTLRGRSVTTICS